MASRRPPRSAPDPYGLLNALLACVDRGRPRADFLKDVARFVLEFAGCDGLELRVRAGEHYYGCTVTARPRRTFTFAAVPGGGVGPIPERATAPRGRRGIAVVPLRAGGALIGRLTLRRTARGFTPADLEHLAELPATLGAALCHEHTQWALRERVKELTCLFGISQAAVGAGSIEEVLARAVAVLPAGWQYPEVCAARITLDGRAFTTAAFGRARQVQRAALCIGAMRRGAVEVAYTEPRPIVHEGPFLKEERSLLDAVAGHLEMIIERALAESERARLQEQLRHADRLVTVGKLAAGAAHELNEPLGAILGFAQLSLRFAGVPPQVRHDLDRIMRAALHGREVVKQLMLFARQTSPQLVPVDLNLIVNEAVEMLRPHWAGSRIVVRRRFGRRLPRVVADAGQLRQVVVNLAVNAVHAMPEGGTLTVTTAATRRAVVLRVADTGEGMTDEVAKQIFRPFYTTKDVGRGTGLGLSVVHGIVTAHGGAIRVETRPRRGTTFEIELPVRPPAEIEEQAQRRQDPGHGRPRRR
jgi:signal transduction histidine kinase